jgi:uncharacterized protein with PQ loop repeat
MLQVKSFRSWADPKAQAPSIAPAGFRAAKLESSMSIISTHSPCAVNAPSASASSTLERTLRVLSVVTMVMTVPQVLTIWVSLNASGVSLASWSAYLVSACLWFVYGVQKHDKTIYVACIGWIVLDAAIVVGVVIHS